MTTREVAARYGTAEITVRAWAKKNNIGRVESVNGIMAYDFSEADCLRFSNRPPKGWKKGVSRKHKPERN